MTDGLIPPVRSRQHRPISWSVGVHLLVVVSVVLLNLLQQPGQITFDTKLDLQLNPADFLARSMTLWNADWALGGLQNQASGYLFPMGPVFLVGELLGVPMWIWERLWSAGVMLLAYEGTRRLAAHWPGIGAAGAILAGLTYMLSPRLLTTVGGMSGESLPAAILPWTVLPLVLYVRGRLRSWVAFVLSAATIPWMGGQNATLVVACVVFPTLLLALAHGRPLRRRLLDLAGWGSLVAAASLWWLLPLLLLGSYSPPFLDFIESAESTAGTTGWLSSLRGTNHWVAFFTDGGPVGWSGGYELASSELLLVTTVLVAAIGLAGLLQRGLWERRVLAASLLVGLAILTAGSGGWAGSVLSDVWLQALDTFLAPLRNIHKFDPLVRLPLSLGVAAWVTAALPWLARRFSSRTARSSAQAVVLMAVAALVISAATPAAQGSLRTDDGFEEVPASWRDAVKYVNDQPQPARVLVLPGAGFAVQTWGRTIDEPIQVLDPPPWVARAQITVSTAGTLRLLDSVEQWLAEARPQPRLAEAFDAMGITHVIVRNDLVPGETGAPSPEVVHATMSNVPGAQVEVTFGRQTDGDPALVVYSLDHDQDPRVDVQAWEGRVAVSGGPEVVPELRAAGLVSDHQASVLAVDGQQPDIVTDSLRRIERSFGRVHDTRSGVMTEQDRYRLDRLAHDYSDAAMPDDRTTAVYDGAAEILASSSAGYADVLGPVRPEQHPYSAFDRSFYTAWETAPFSPPQGQWVEVKFEQPTDVDAVSLTFDTVGGASVRSVRIATDNESVVADIRADGTAPNLDLNDNAANRLRITVLEAGSDTGKVRLSDVRISGHDITRSLVLPGSVSASTAVFLSSETPRRSCAVSGEDGSVTCDVRRHRETSETPGFNRDISVSESGTWHLGGRAIATNGDAVHRLFAPLADDKVEVFASSTYAGDPAVTAAGAVDGRPETGWTSAPNDPAATLHLSWGPRRRITEVDAFLSPGHPGRLPEALVVDGGPGTGKSQLVATTGAQAGEMRPVRTNQLRITALGAAGPDGIGISELEVTGIEDLVHKPNLDGPTGTACGFGPTIEVARQTVRTRLTGTLRDVRSGAALTVIPCGSRTLPLPPGTHRVRVTNPAGFATTSLSLVPQATRQAVPVGRARVLSWSATERRVEVSTRAQSVLAVTESFNRGWTASLSDVDLEPVVLEGWGQGFVLPAGTTGAVELEYAPQAGFRAALVVGLAMAGVLVLMAMFLLLAQARARRRSVRAPYPDRLALAEARPLRKVVGIVILFALALVSLPLALGAGLARLSRGRHDPRLAAACAGALVFAALIALSRSSVVVPPVSSDIIVALVVGLVCGRASVRPVTVPASRTAPSEGVG